LLARWFCLLILCGAVTLLGGCDRGPIEVLNAEQAEDFLRLAYEEDYDVDDLRCQQTLIRSATTFECFVTVDGVRERACVQPEDEAPAIDDDCAAAAQR
jgi:hypothetical protein